MGAYIDKYDFIISGCLRVAFYRSLHILSVPFSVHEVLSYAREQESGEGRFGGSLDRFWNGPFVEGWRWNNVQVGKGLGTDFRFFGVKGGAQTVIYRSHLWKGNFAQRSLFP